MARIAATVWIALVVALAGYATAQTTPGATDTTGVTGTVGDMTTENSTESTSTPSTKPTEPKSTKKPETTPEPEIPTFKTPDGSGSYCMIIALNARVTTKSEEGEKETSSKVPADAVIDEYPFECPQDQNDAYIQLSWTSNELDWVLGLMFEAEDDTYTMTMVNGSYTTEIGNMTVWSDDEFDFPEVELGHSVHCRGVDIGHFLYFEEYKFQPFAQRSKGGFGEAEECKSDASGLDTVWIIVISVAGGIVLLALLAGICMFCSKRSKQSSYDKV